MRKNHRSSLSSALSGQDRSLVSRCVKCGTCSAVCPPFLADREESQSPRGRMALIKALLDGRLAPSTLFRDRLDTCTGCLACETACPSSVPVTAIIQAAKELALQESGRSILKSVLAAVLRHPPVMRLTSAFAPLVLHYRSQAVRGGGAQRSHRFSFQLRSPRKPDGRAGKKTVVFFPGCAVSYFQPEIQAASVRVLNSMGYAVVVPDGLLCCGRPLLSLGEREAARSLARHNIAVLSPMNADAVITPCPSCALTFKREYPTLFGADSPVLVQDIHAFLADRRTSLHLNQLEKTVTWHDPCHLGRGQGLAGSGRMLLRTVPGITIREMQNADACCGFGGVMRVTHKDISNRIADAKIRAISATGATVAATGCPGCRMQIAEGIRRAGMDVGVLHTVQVLEEALPDKE
jgi:glycolate oxidase iron-sulfur subunit